VVEWHSVVTYATYNQARKGINMPPSWVDINVGGQNMEGYLTRPEAEGRHPAVVVIQEVWGVNSHIQGVTDRLPSQGYVGLAPAMFHREGPMTIGAHEEFPLALERMGRCTDANIVADVRAAVDYLKTQPFVQADKIGIVGFCFGGRVSYLAACNISDIKATSVFYGGRLLGPLGGDGPAPVQQTANLASPVLGLFGEDDQNPTPADVATVEAELKKQGKEYEFHIYPGCGHGFHCDGRPSYRAEAAKHAWGRTMEWFDTHLKG
jgi:carboxymethylenebutenolidase